MAEGQQEGAGQQRDNSPPPRPNHELKADSLDLAAPVLGAPAVAQFAPLPNNNRLQNQVRQLHAELINEDPALAARLGPVLQGVAKALKGGNKPAKRENVKTLYRAEKAAGRLPDLGLKREIRRKADCDMKTVNTAIREVDAEEMSATPV